ncbi:protein yippee-like At5g53940 isoform X5 [Musa acuminata AAA Group]|uniref:protein yippee-like At5g53940 isoform X5 n=1 Tax=Musa acuminata AAA Group TaxID=214697 RepID=UPI0031D45B36
MGRIFMVELDGRVYRCRFCRTQLALIEDLISKSFHCRHGKAYLFNHGTNISVGDEEERVLFSGMHTVADIFCCCCGQNVGWKYVVAQEKTPKVQRRKIRLGKG